MNKQLAVLTLAAFGAACSADEPGRLPRSVDPVSVTVSAEQRAAATERFAATVVSERSAEIATRASGIVEEVPVEVGAVVTRGQAIVLLDDSDVAARVAASSAALELAERFHARISNLAADGAASQQELDQSAASLAEARAAAAGADAQQAYAIVRAPFDGVVVSRSVDPGDLAVPGATLLTVVASDDLKIVADLPAHRLGTVVTGQEVTVEVDGVEGAISARVVRTVPALGAGSRTFRVEARLMDPPLGVRPGAFARVVLPLPGDGPRWIPADAVIERGQLRGVLAVENDTLRLRWLRLGQQREGAVEVLAGPNRPLTVVRRPAMELQDGLAVAAVSIEAWTPVRGGPVEGMDR